MVFKELKSRQEKNGLNVFRIRYLGIKQNKSRSNFEEDILKATLNGEDIGDINHIRNYAKYLDKAIYKTINCDIQDNMNCLNPLTKYLFVPLMLEVPPVHNQSAQGLAESTKEVFNNAGLSDNQLEGLDWDGEYIKKVLRKN